jgi:hypothetical protein
MIPLLSRPISIIRPEQIGSGDIFGSGQGRFSATVRTAAHDTGNQ